MWLCGDKVKDSWSWRTRLQSPTYRLQPDVQNHSAPHSCSIDWVVQVHHLASVLLLDLLAQPRPELHRPPTVLQCRSGRQWNTSLIYMVNLASTDLMYSFSLPFLVASYVMRGRWVFGDFMCRLVRFLFLLQPVLQHLLPHLYIRPSLHGNLSSDQKHALESKRVVRGICATVWVIVFILTCPIVKFAKQGSVLRKIGGGVNKANDSWSESSGDAGKVDVEVYRNCWDDAIDSEFSEYVPYGIVLHLLGFFFPFIVIAWCYSHVVWTIFQTLHCQPQVQEEGGMCCRVEGVKDRTSMSISGSQHAPYLNRRRKSIKIIITITILFALCFLPFHITRTLFLVLKETKAAECQTMRMISICYKITRPLASCNSWLNALLYFLTGDKASPAVDGPALLITPTCSGLYRSLEDRKRLRIKSKAIHIKQRSSWKWLQIFRNNIDEVGNAQSLWDSPTFML